MHNFEVFQLPFHLGCLDRLQIQHEEKSFIVGASSMMPVLASIWGAFFSVTFKLPFHALPLLSPHPASFRSFTPWASSLVVHLPGCMKLPKLNMWCLAESYCAFALPTWDTLRKVSEVHRFRTAGILCPQQNNVTLFALCFVQGVVGLERHEPRASEVLWIQADLAVRTSVTGNKFNS